MCTSTNSLPRQISIDNTRNSASAQYTGRNRKASIAGRGNTYNWTKACVLQKSMLRHITRGSDRRYDANWKKHNRSALRRHESESNSENCHRAPHAPLVSLFETHKAWKNKCLSKVALPVLYNVEALKTARTCRQRHWCVFIALKHFCWFSTGD